jgi:hypothetical protein
MATITFTSGSAGGNTFLLGDGGSVAVNVNATSFTVGTITGSQPANFTATTYSNGGAGSENGFGKFNLTVNSFDGYTNSSNTISFTITNTGSTTWANASDVLKTNVNGSLAAAHIFVASCGSGATCTPDPAAGALATGYAANGGSVEITPLPSAFVLLGSVLVGGLGASTWRRRRRGPVSIIGGPVSVIA